MALMLVLSRRARRPVHSNRSPNPGTSGAGTASNHLAPLRSTCLHLHLDLRNQSASKITGVIFQPSIHSSAYCATHCSSEVCADQLSRQIIGRRTVAHGASSVYTEAKDRPTSFTNLQDPIVTQNSYLLMGRPSVGDPTVISSKTNHQDSLGVSGSYDPNGQHSLAAFPCCDPVPLCTT